MEHGSRRLSGRHAFPRPVLLALALLASVLLIVLLAYRPWRLDERFLRFSAPGLMGLARYLAGDYAGAARAYRSDLRLRMEGHPDRFGPAWRALVAGDLAEAKRAAQAEASTMGPATQALLTLGEIALAEGAPAEALRIFDDILRGEVDQFDALLLGSVAHARLGAYGSAVGALNRALRHNRVETRPTSFLSALETAGDLARMPPARRPWCLLAHYHRYLRIYDPSNGRLAIRNAERAVEVGDRPDDAYLTIGIVHRRHQRPDLALQAFLHAIEANPRHPEALRWAAGIYSDRGDLASEYRLRKAAFEAAPDDPYHADHFYDLLFTKLGDYVQALALTRRSLERNPEDRESLARLGAIYRALGDDEQALDLYRKALVVAPRDPALHEGVGWLLLSADRPDEARAAFETALALHPSWAFAHVGLGAVHQRQRRYREAIAAYERGLRLGGLENADRLLALCSLYSQMAAFDRAEWCARRALAMDPHHTGGHHLLEDARFNLKLQKSRQ